MSVCRWEISGCAQIAWQVPEAMAPSSMPSRVRPSDSVSGPLTGRTSDWTICSLIQYQDVCFPGPVTVNERVSHITIYYYILLSLFQRKAFINHHHPLPQGMGHTQNVSVSFSSLKLEFLWDGRASVRLCRERGRESSFTKQLQSRIEDI